jgi:F-box-like
MVAYLHYDILCVVFRFLESDRNTLFNCSLVNKEFNFVASQNLYRTIVVPVFAVVSLSSYDFPFHSLYVG